MRTPKALRALMTGLFSLALCLGAALSGLAQGNPNQLNFFFKQTVGAQSYQDESAILFLAGGSRGRDAFDANNLASSNVDGASVPVPGLVLAINVMPELTTREVIPLTFNTATGQARIVVVGFSSFPLGTRFYLRDSLLHQTIQLGLTGTGTVADSSVYNFTVSTNPASEGLGRLTLIFEPAGIGPTPCPPTPTANTAEITRCGPGLVQASLASVPNGCTAEWFLKSSGTTGTPLATGSAFSRSVSVSDTLLVRYACAGVCNTAFTKIPVTVEMSPFNISLSPSSASPGSTIRITGTLLNLADRVTLSGVSLPFQLVSNNEITFVLPQGPPSGFVKVIDDGGSACPDSASFTVIPGNCLAPTPVAAQTTFCGQSMISLQVDSITPGCSVRWFLASRGTSGTPLATTPALQTLLNNSDTILVQKVCGTSCASAFAKVAITINRTPFRIRLAPTTGQIGTQVRIRGTQMRQVQRVRYNGVEVPFQGTTDTVLTIQVPAGAQTGYISVHGASGVCPDSALFTVTRPCNAPISYTVTGSMPVCGARQPVFTVDSVAGTGCQIQWYLASAGTGNLLSTDSVFSVPLTQTDTVLVRRFCSSTCISAFTRIPVVVRTSPFGIQANPADAREGDTVQVTGASLDKVSHITLAGQPLIMESQRDSLIRVVLPAGSQTGYLVVTDSTGLFCPDSVLITILPGGIDTCDIQPLLDRNYVSLCEAGTVRIRNLESHPSCVLEWYLVSEGLGNPPNTVGDTFEMDFTDKDTIVVRRMCAPGCASDFVRIPVDIGQSPFQISLTPDSGRAGDLVAIHGFMMDSVRNVFMASQRVDIRAQNRGTVLVQVPGGLPLGNIILKVTSPFICADSAKFRVILITGSRPALTGAIAVRPNPARNAFTVAMPAGTAGPVALELVDLSGRVVATHRASGQDASIPMSLKGIPAGLYHLRVRAEGQVWVEKVVIE